MKCALHTRSLTAKLSFFFFFLNLWWWDGVEHGEIRGETGEGERRARDSGGGARPRPPRTGDAVGDFLFCGVCWNVKKYY